MLEEQLIEAESRSTQFFDLRCALQQLHYTNEARAAEIERLNQLLQQGTATSLTNPLFESSKNLNDTASVIDTEDVCHRLLQTNVTNSRLDDDDGNSGRSIEQQNSLTTLNPTSNHRPVASSSETPETPPSLGGSNILHCSKAPLRPRLGFFHATPVHRNPIYSQPRCIIGSSPPLDSSSSSGQLFDGSMDSSSPRQNISCGHRIVSAQVAQSFEHENEYFSHKQFSPKSHVGDSRNRNSTTPNNPRETDSKCPGMSQNSYTDIADLATHESIQFTSGEVIQSLPPKSPSSRTSSKFVASTNIGGDIFKSAETQQLEEELIDARFQIQEYQNTLEALGRRTRREISDLRAIARKDRRDRLQIEQECQRLLAKFLELQQLIVAMSKADLSSSSLDQDEAIDRASVLGIFETMSSQ